MAYELNYTSETGAVFPASYWKVTKVEIDVLNRTIIYTLSGYKDQAAANDKRPVAVRTYKVERNLNKDYKFADLMSGFNDGSLNLLGVGYNLAKDIKDCETGEMTTRPVERVRQVMKTVFDEATQQNITALVEESYTENILDKPVLDSFFKGATKV